MIAKLRRTIPMAVAVLSLGFSASPSWGQGYNFNPYGNSGYADYREFAYPTYSINPALPGQARLSNESMISRARPNSYRQFLDEFESEINPSSSRTKGLASRNYKSNNNPQNQEFVERMKQRDLAYTKALQEKDPIKRAKLLRQIENEPAERMKLNKTPANSPGRAPEPNATARGTTPSRAPAPLGARRSTAPPPPSSPSSRSSSSGSTAPAIPGLPRPRTAPGTTPRPAPDPSTVAVPPPG